MSIPRVPGGAINTLVGVGLAIVTAILIFLVTTSYTNLVSRLDRLEASQAGQNESLAAMHIQLDTINTRGTTAAESRLTALETRAAVLDGRVARLEDGTRTPGQPR